MCKKSDFMLLAKGKVQKTNHVDCTWTNSDSHFVELNYAQRDMALLRCARGMVLERFNRTIRSRMKWKGIFPAHARIEKMTSPPTWLEQPWQWRMTFTVLHVASHYRETSRRSTLNERQLKHWHLHSITKPNCMSQNEWYWAEPNSVIS